MLTVITGCMFAGKSSKLIAMATAHAIAGHNVIAFKPSNDIRYGGEYITTHHMAKFMATSINVHDPWDIVKQIKNFTEQTEKEIDVIIVDEVQFFHTSIIEVVEYLLYQLGKTIILSGLSQDSSGKPFGAMPYLLAIADDIVHLKAVCSKSKKIGAATRTYRKDISNTNQVAVGGAEMYEPRSFQEWLTSPK